MRKTLLFAASLLCSLTSFAATATYAPTLDVNFRTATGNTAWVNGFPKNAADEGNTEWELTYAAGLFVMQKYTVADLENATKLVLTLTVGSKSGVDAVDVWSFTNNDWTPESDIDDIVSAVESIVGVAPRATEGTANTPLAKGAKVAGSDPAKATLTIQGTALQTLKANATADGTFTLLITNNAYTNPNSKRSMLNSNEANDEANRPVLEATIETPSVVNVGTGASYSSLTEAFNAAVTAGTDAELQVYEDQKLSGRLTLNKAITITITPMADITIKGQPGQMWFLANVNDAFFQVGGSDYTITLDGENKAYTGKDVTKYENNSTISLKNVVFQNFDLNGEGHLVGSKAQQGLQILNNVTFRNCVNPGDAFIYKARVTNDRLLLRGFLNQEDCTGATIYAASETKTSGTTGRIKLDKENEDDADFTTNADITIVWPGEKAEGIVVVIGTKGANAPFFRLANTTDWWLARKASNGDLYMTQTDDPVTAIDNVELNSTDNTVYNLRGQRVEKATKGLYIIGGRKVVVK